MSILFGDGARSFIHDFSSELKYRTLNIASSLDGFDHGDYNPWLCARPALAEPIHESLLNIDFPKGGLVIDPDHLRAIQKYLDGQGALLMENMPVAAADWPVMVDIKSTRPDAISAFHEGRALLACSPFLEEVYDDLVEFVVPQNRERPSGFDSAYARGVIFRTFPKNRGGLLAGFQIAHAMGHQAAIMLLAADPLIASDPDKEIFYRVRNDRRSANHAIVSAVALGYMVVLMRDLYKQQIRPFIADDHVRGYSEHLPDAVGLAVSSILDGCQLTAVGRQVAAELSALQ